MTVCRYFLQGNCRFGDRCRFEHTDPYSTHYETTPRRNDYNRYDSRSYNYNSRGRNDYSYDDDGLQTSYSNQQYNQRYYPSENNQYRSSYSKNDRYNTQARSGYGMQEGNSYQQNYYANKNEWVSDDYRRQTEQRRNTELFSSSTPKSKINFSFKDPEIQAKKDHSIDLHMNENNLVYAELIKDDIKTWELGSQWPFTCYSPIQERSSFPGFIDLSPEELRYEAYKAKENNTYDSYVESVNKVLQNIKLRRDQLKEPSVQMISMIERFRNGQDLVSESSVDGIFPLTKSNKSVLEDMVAEESVVQKCASSFSFKTTLENDNVSKSSASNFSFKTTLENDNASKSSASNFSFKLPPNVELKQSSQVTGSDIYSPLEKLSNQDKEQFSASTFTLGKIPTMPPPQALCF
ncbi:hypothetical protein NPIL_303711 [Nephila pilipes]|uniref:Nucleoporin NUP42 n=1 Tax=Nephila pilipes TaxID=299642 RepID=A0A8X6N8C4_NEPPI|nr:hypothetical protein NPIL_303711 [Nephila pilipes]